MSQKYECSSILCCSIHRFISGFCQCCIHNCLSNSCLVIIYNSGIIPYLTKHRFCYSNVFKLILIFFESIDHLIVLCTMHQMGRLYNQIFYTVCSCAIQCLLHIVNYFTISCLYVVNDDLCGKGTSYCPVRIRILESILNSFDILHTAVIVGSAKAYYQQLVLADFICISRIIQGCISRIQSKVIRACFLTFHQFLLCVSQAVPCFFCCNTVFICGFCSFLHINPIDQCRHIVRRCLVCVFAFCSFPGFCLLCHNGCCSHHHCAAHGYCKKHCQYRFSFHVFFLFFLYFRKEPCKKAAAFLQPPLSHKHTVPV